MAASDQFLRFAAECEIMARITPSADNEIAWRRMAERWVRYAEQFARQDSASQAAKSAKQRRQRARRSVH
jgi:hypothetical protein